MSTENPRIHTFLVLKEPGQADRIIVWDTQEITLGRAAENDVVIDDVEISRRHAQFVRTGKSYVVQNLNRSNGTLVNGAPTTNQALQSGDEIRFAEVVVVFYQSTRDPVALGRKLQYASQLKEFEGPAIGPNDGEATMLGLVDSVPDSDETFEVKPASDFAYELHGMESPPPRAPARDLDLELEGFGLDDLDMPGEASGSSREPQASTSPEFFELDDVAEPPSAVSLHLEIQGLEGDLRRTVQALLGKVFELPALKIRIVNEDLD